MHIYKEGNSKRLMSPLISRRFREADHRRIYNAPAYESPIVVFMDFHSTICTTSLFFNQIRCYNKNYILCKKRSKAAVMKMLDILYKTLLVKTLFNGFSGHATINKICN